MLQLPNEIWCKVPWCEEYEVSSMGKVRACRRVQIRKNGVPITVRQKIRKQWINNMGYPCVDFWINNHRKHALVHRLVAQAFLPNPDNLPEVNHKDENPLNSSVHNLEWCDSKYNNNYGSHTARMQKTKGKPVQAINPDTGEVVAEFPSAAEAGRNGYISTCVTNCCHNKQHTHRGLIWQYVYISLVETPPTILYSPSHLSE